jgi:hypothetical protein
MRWILLGRVLFYNEATHLTKLNPATPKPLEKIRMFINPPVKAGRTTSSGKADLDGPGGSKRLFHK